MKEPSVPALPPARKRKRVRPQGRPRAAGPTKAARRIHRIKTTLVPGPIPWLLRKAVADIDIVFGGGCHPAPAQSGAFTFFMDASSHRLNSRRPPASSHARAKQPAPNVPSHIPRTCEAVIASLNVQNDRNGSTSDLGAGNREVCFAPVNGHRSSRMPCLKSADFVAEVGDDNGGAAVMTRLLMRRSVICCTGSG